MVKRTTRVEAAEKELKREGERERERVLAPCLSRPKGSLRNLGPKRYIDTYTLCSSLESSRGQSMG